MLELEPMSPAMKKIQKSICRDRNTDYDDITTTKL